MFVVAEASSPSRAMDLREPNKEPLETIKYLKIKNSRRARVQGRYRDLRLPAVMLVLKHKSAFGRASERREMCYPTLVPASAKSPKQRASKPEGS